MTLNKLVGFAAVAAALISYSSASAQINVSITETFDGNGPNSDNGGNVPTASLRRNRIGTSRWKQYQLRLWWKRCLQISFQISRSRILRRRR